MKLVTEIQLFLLRFNSLRVRNSGVNFDVKHQFYLYYVKTLPLPWALWYRDPNLFIWFSPNHCTLNKHTFTQSTCIVLLLKTSLRLQWESLGCSSANADWELYRYQFNDMCRFSHNVFLHKMLMVNLKIHFSHKLQLRNWTHDSLLER